MTTGFYNIQEKHVKSYLLSQQVYTITAFLSGDLTMLLTKVHTCNST